MTNHKFHTHALLNVTPGFIILIRIIKIFANNVKFITTILAY
jgi:hypothetical protein